MEMAMSDSAKQSQLNDDIMKQLYLVAFMQGSKFPTCLGTGSKCNKVNVLGDGCTAVDVRSHVHQTILPVVLKSDHPIPITCSVYYFEISVNIKSRSGLLALGVCSSRSSTTEWPGMEITSYGYHSNSGKIYNNSKELPVNAPVYGESDVIGCGVNFVTNSVFFTKNGVCIGPVHIGKKLPHPVYPCIAFASPNCYVVVNFGQHKFAFDIGQYIARERALAISTAIDRKCNDRLAYVTLRNLVATYLLHYGYLGSAQAFGDWVRIASLPSTDTRLEHATNSQELDSAPTVIPDQQSNNVELKSTDQSNDKASGQSTDEKKGGNAILTDLFSWPETVDRLLRRCELRDTIKSGNYLIALEHFERYFKLLSELDPSISFVLRCHHFIDLINRYYSNIKLKNENVTNESCENMPETKTAKLLSIVSRANDTVFRTSQKRPKPSSFSDSSGDSLPNGYNHNHSLIDSNFVADPDCTNEKDHKSVDGICRCHDFCEGNNNDDNSSGGHHQYNTHLPTCSALQQPCLSLNFCAPTRFRVQSSDLCNNQNEKAINSSTDNQFVGKSNPITVQGQAIPSTDPSLLSKNDSVVLVDEAIANGNSVHLAEENSSNVLSSHSAPMIQLDQLNHFHEGGEDSTCLCGSNSPIPNRSSNSELLNLIEYGRNLRGIAIELQKQGAITLEQLLLLSNAFSLVAYEDPYQSPLSSLLHPKHREILADTVNDTILVHLKQPPRPFLDTAINFLEHSFSEDDVTNRDMYLLSEYCSKKDQHQVRPNQPDNVTPGLEIHSPLDDLPNLASARTARFSQIRSTLSSSRTVDTQSLIADTQSHGIGQTDSSSNGSSNLLRPASASIISSSLYIPPSALVSLGGRSMTITRSTASQRSVTRMRPVSLQSLIHQRRPSQFSDQATTSTPPHTSRVTASTVNWLNSTPMSSATPHTPPGLSLSHVAPTNVITNSHAPTGPEFAGFFHPILFIG